MLLYEAPLHFLEQKREKLDRRAKIEKTAKKYFMKDIQSNHLLEGSIIRSLLTLSIPIVLANILQAGYQIIDAFWVGRLGGAAVAAVSVSFPITFLMIALGAGLAVAGSTLIAQYVGAKNEKMVNHVAGQTILMIIVVSLILGSLGFVLAPYILQLMGVAPEVYEGALGFMRVSFIGLVFQFVFFMFQSIMRGIGQVTLPVYIVLGTVILNFILDPLFIFGWGPIANHGVMGAALATLGTQSLAALVGLGIFMKGKYGIHLSLKDFTPDLAFMKKAFFLGFPASVEQSARALGMTMMTFLIASFGTLTMAAYGVGSTIIQIAMIPAMGLSMAISVLVGQNIGAGNVVRADQIARFGTILSFFTLTGVGIIVFIFAPSIITFFIPGNEEVITGGTTLLRTMSLAWGFLGIQFSLTGVFRASGNMIIAMMLALISQWVLQFPLAYLLSKHTSLGVNGIWWAFPLSNILIALITMAFFAKGDWKKKRLVEEDELMERVSEEVFVEEGVR